jgi:ubiquinone/menaquinone biosynthesis C-methylase UbiE
VKRVQDAVTQFWNVQSLVDNYDDTPAESNQRHDERAAWRAELRRVLPAPPAHVVDLGSGTGYISLLLAELGYDVRGIDIAPTMLARARADAARLGLQVSFEHGDVHDPPGAAASADAVTARHVFWTLERPAAALAGVLRLLRPGGRLVIAEGLYMQSGYEHGAPSTSWYEDSRRLYTDAVTAALPLLGVGNSRPLERLVQDAGYVDIEVSPASIVARVEAEYGDEIGMRAKRFLLTARKPC